MALVTESHLIVARAHGACESGLRGINVGACVLDCSAAQLDWAVGHVVGPRVIAEALAAHANCEVIDTIAPSLLGHSGYGSGYGDGDGSGSGFGFGFGGSGYDGSGSGSGSGD